MNVSQIAVLNGISPPFHQHQVAEVSLMLLVSPSVLPVLQYHLSQIDEAVKYSDSKIDLDKLFQTQAMYPYTSLLDRLTARETFVNSFRFPVKILFGTDAIATIE